MVRQVVVTGIGGYDMLKVDDDGRDLPSPATNQVLVEVKSCGINFYDLYVRHGLSPDIKPPCVLGLECAGIITAIGNTVNTVKVGDRVAVHCPDGGAFSEAVLVEETSVMKIPDNLTYDQAAALTINYLTAYFSLFHLGNLKADGAVLIHSAAGGVGWAATQLAKTVPNVTVFGTSSAHKHSAIVSNGVDVPIDYTQDYTTVVRDLRPSGVSVVLDSLVGPHLMLNLKLLQPLGKVVILGAKGMVNGEKRSWFSVLSTVWRTKDISPHFLIMNNCGVTGINLNELRKTVPEIFRVAWKKMMEDCSSGIVCPRIDSTWKFDQIEEACKRISERENIGKVIIHP